MRCARGVFGLPVALAFLLVAHAGAAAQTSEARIGAIDFFGYKGLDVYTVRGTLRLAEGDPLPSGARLSEESTAIRGRVKEAIGVEPTDVTFVCCDAQQRWLLYVGLPGSSSRRPTFNPVPHGDIRLPRAIVTLHRALDDALEAGITSGIAAEDGSRGFALSAYAPARDNQLALQRFTLENERLIFAVLDTSSDADHRAVAARALGYARESDRQVDALVKASLDDAEGVRNNAIRALAVLVRARPAAAGRIPVRPYVDLLRSGTWSDHNKAVLLLDALTARREPHVLAALRSDAMDALIEMARWKHPGHAIGARMIIGRIAGLDDKRLRELATNDQVDAIIGSLKP
jgi:hypothetical protein